MNFLVTAEEMRRYDTNASEKIGIPSIVLMERAALEVCRRAEEILEKQGTILVLCGVGNNGADGLASARLLAAKGYKVEVIICGKEEKATAQWQIQKKILEHYRVKIGNKLGGDGYTVIIDAMFGVGLHRAIEGEYADVLENVNQQKGWKLAVDVPSGVDADTGQILGCAFRADETVCFAYGKRGLFFYPGCEYAGKVTICDIGIDSRAFMGKEPEMFAYTEEKESLLPKRRADGNKGTFGKVLLAAGQKDMAGAAVLAAKSCIGMGAGMVKVVTPECNRVILQTAVPETLLKVWPPVGAGECMTDRNDTASKVLPEVGLREENRKEAQEGRKGRLGINEGDALTFAPAEFDWPDILAIGPGLGQGEKAKALMEAFLQESRKPLVIDADGLNLLSVHPQWLETLARQGKEGRQIILTPHVRELGRLTKQEIPEIKKHPLESALGLARALNCVIVSKDARTLTVSPDGKSCMNLSGNSGMATAGSGDVLTGMIAGLLAQGMPCFEAAAAGAYLHGLAGDKAAARYGEYGVTAGRIVEAL